MHRFDLDPGSSGHEGANDETLPAAEWVHAEQRMRIPVLHLRHRLELGGRKKHQVHSTPIFDRRKGLRAMNSGIERIASGEIGA